MLACCLLFLLFDWTAGTTEDYRTDLEPGHAEQEYDSVEEVRGHDNETIAEKPAEDEHLMREAILDIAYYLRRFKFSGHDPRYLAEGEIPRRNLFVEFPSPPLRNIHWEVKKNCEPSFVECVKYLHEKISESILPRHLDSLTITRQNAWSFITDKNLIQAADKECLKLLERDQTTFEMFSGPVQKFQWLTSASYYMCFYTMKEISHLRNFTEDCDNYASCIHWKFGLNNNDVRADKSRPFACASYSFCPDPCCSLKHVSHWSSCIWESPCLGSLNKTCTFVRKENVDFEALMLNQWNVSCKCDEPGMRWESKSGMCVDIDECVESPCIYPAETCRNLPGTYKCMCSPLGYRSHPKRHICETDPTLHSVFYPRHLLPENRNYSFSSRFSSRCEQLWNDSCYTYLLAVGQTKEYESNATKRPPC